MTKYSHSIFYFKFDEKQYYVPKFSPNFYLDKNYLNFTTSDLRSFNQTFRLLKYFFYNYNYNDKEYIFKYIKNNHLKDEFYVHGKKRKENEIDIFCFYLSYIKVLFYFYYICRNKKKNKKLVENILDLKVVRVLESENNVHTSEKNIEEYFKVFDIIDKNIENFSNNLFDILNNDNPKNHMLSYSLYYLPLIIDIVFNRNFDFYDQKDYLLLFDKSMLFTKENNIKQIFDSIKTNFKLKDKKIFKIFGNKIFCIKTKNEEVEFFIKVMCGLDQNVVFEKINKNYLMNIYKILR